MELAPFIRELILHNECIILPGFGGFETVYTPAEFDSRLKIMLPPSKKITFKKEYSSGGEILEQYITKKLRIPQDKARILIEEYVSVIMLKLSNGEKAVIGGVGDFQADSSGNFLFTPISEENYLAESFGLEPLPVSFTKKNSPKQNKQKSTLVVSSRRNTLAFVIVGVILISILLTITIILSSKFNIYLFNIGDKKTKSEKIIIGGTQLTDSSLTKINQEIEEYTSVKQALSISPDKNTTSVSEIQKEYFLVAGSFSTYSNAAELDKKLKAEGFTPTIIKIGPYYKVCLGRFRDKASAIDEMDHFHSKMDRPLTIISVEGK